MSSGTRPSAVRGALRSLEALALVASLVGIVLFASSALTIWRIESAAGEAAAVAGAREIPWNAWYGIFTFLGSMAVLVAVRWAMRRTERTEPRAVPARPSADQLARLARVTAEVLDARTGDEGEAAGAPLYSDAEGAAMAAEETGA